MIVCTIRDYEGQAFDTETNTETYISYNGRGVHLRSVKKAVEAARADQKRDMRRKSKRYPCGGVPVLGEMTIIKDGKILLERFD